MKLHVKDFGSIDKLVIVPKGDEHIGSKFYDQKKDCEIINWCLETRSYVIGMGDNVETATRDSVGAGVFEQDRVVQEQIDLYVELNKPLADAGLLLGLHRGNHELRLYNYGGIDITKIIAGLLGVKYFGDGVAHFFRVGKQTYTMFTAHGNSKAIKPHTKIKAALDYADMVEVDVVAIGHTHQLSHHTRLQYVINKRKRIVERHEKNFVLTGGYLDHWDSYAFRKGYEQLKKGSPKVKFSGVEKRIRVSL